MNIKAPNEGLTDKVINYAKAISELIPVGGTVSGILLELVKSPYQKRVEIWQIMVTDALNDLMTSGFKIEDLKKNDEFIDIVLQTAAIAIRQHQEEKRQALKNAIIHSVNKDAPMFELQHLFLNYIDMFTLIHIKLLKFMQDPSRISQQQFGFGGISHHLLKEIIELQNDRELLNAIWDDLYSKGLLSAEKSILDVTMTGSGIYTKRTTSLADKFIKYIDN